MALRQSAAFVDSYMQRLQEQSWAENDELYAPYTTDRESFVTVGSHNSSAFVKSRVSLSADLKLQGHPHHSTTTTTTTTKNHHKRGLGHESIPSKQTPRQPLLEKRYRFGSVPVTSSITSSSGPARRSAGAHSSSPSNTRKSFRKIRKGYPSKLSPHTPARSSHAASTSRRAQVGQTIPSGIPSTSHASRLPLNFSLPRVGQRSDTLHNGEETKLKLKAYKRGCSLSPTQSRSSHQQRQNASGFRLQSERSHDRDGRGDVRLRNHHHKKSASASVVGVAKLWGCVGMKGWRGGECCCEDLEEEMGISLIRETDSIEDATDESLLEEGDTEEEERGVERGFSDEDLTDFEEDDVSSSHDHPTIHVPCGRLEIVAMEQDLVTRTLLQKACHQLQELSVESSTDTDTGEEGSSDVETMHTRRIKTTEKETLQEPRRTKHDETEPNSFIKDHQQEQEKPKEQRSIGRKADSLPPTGRREGGVITPPDPSIPSPALTPSRFPGQQPTIHFPMADELFTPLPPAQQSLLKWKMSTITPNVIKICIARAGFTQCTKGGGWLGYWGKHMRSQAFRAVREHQKVNHFPGSFEIGRKDRLWRNLARLQGRVGKKDLNFVPLTFVLPHDLRLLKREWVSGDQARQKWILKPPAAARGIGVKVVHKWTQIPKKRPIIVQRYISDPFLINGSKFDLRVYVYVSSFDPLKIYVFRDGLTRFATCKYSSSMRSLSNRFIHITNYSVNKKNVQFTQNPDETQCQGHKWGLLALWQYMSSELGLNTDAIWESIKDLVVKTIICSESHCSSLVKACVQNSYSCHELFGFDVMLDRKLKPWIIEVNISPSLHSNSQLDFNIKGRVVRDLLNMAGFKLPHRDPQQTTERGTYTQSNTLTTEERQKRSQFLQRALPESERRKILDTLTADDMAVLMQTEDEFSRRGMFERVFPSCHSSRYRKLFESERYYNILLEQWTLKYQKQPSKGIHLLQRLGRSSVARKSTTSA